MAFKTREECNAYAREWARRNPEKRRETARKWRLAHGAKHDAYRRAYRAANAAKVKAGKEKWARENPDRVAAATALARIRREQKRIAGQLDRLYNFTLKDYEALATAQGHRCAICGRENGNDAGDRLCVDHDHESGGGPRIALQSV